MLRRIRKTLQVTRIERMYGSAENLSIRAVSDSVVQLVPLGVEYLASSYEQLTGTIFNNSKDLENLLFIVTTKGHCPARMLLL